ncbi:ATP-binding cassette domain-containing protein [Microseira wollei]|uniref:ABC transporter n=1 Tax=Microseira wollei NIES-4236 TaxID=2530354 RepID=A0AAV3XUP7_9CYAN|nr:ABC transporter ATP-binding protein [Microseira wollei]GET44577.1 ABC transporter [Microseira wollei NIES-4236]
MRCPCIPTLTLQVERGTYSPSNSPLVKSIESRERIICAVEQADAKALIEELPKGLDTLLGSEFGQRQLSGGEWQKLALARAFMRHSQIQVLDEPTSAQDIETEHDIYKRFSQLSCNRITVLISHRLSAVRMADRILYLANGRIQEIGSHAELMALNGEYARLYKLQALQYGYQTTEELG